MRRLSEVKRSRAANMLEFGRQPFSADGTHTVVPARSAGLAVSERSASAHGQIFALSQARCLSHHQCLPSADLLPARRVLSVSRGRACSRVRVRLEDLGMARLCSDTKSIARSSVCPRLCARQIAWSGGELRAGKEKPRHKDSQPRELRKSVQILAPKILQGVIAAVNDFYTARLASKIFGNPVHAEAAVGLAL